MLLEPVERGDVRVIQLSQEPGLPLEAVQALAVLGEGFREHLDGHVPAQLGVAGSVDLPHPTRTDGLDDLVLAELGTWGEGHGQFVGTSRSSSWNQFWTMTTISGLGSTFSL